MKANERLLEIARGELGYHEKESDDRLDQPAANAGNKNYTKYARDLHRAGYYQADKQGYDWCDVFVDWCFLQLCGSRELAEKVQCQTGPYGAGCSWSARYYEAQGRLFYKFPVKGDQIFFRDYSHTGIVEQVRDGWIDTIEGNSHNRVECRSYRAEDDRITSFGRPFYHLVPEEGSLFSDVPKDAYYAEAVDWAVEAGIVRGVGGSRFAPDRACRRAEAVTMLWRMEHSPEPEGSQHPFADVQPEAYYARAVRWAVRQGITSGTDSTHFSPDSSCTPGPLVTLLWRLAGSPACSGTEFADVEPGDYFSDAVYWAFRSGITDGIYRGHFGPAEPCTRGMIVTMLHRYSLI